MRFELFPEYFPQLLAGVPMTLQLAALSLFLGFFLAVLLAVLRTSGIAPLVGFVKAYVYVFRGTPLLVQIFLIYYGTGQFDLIKQSFLWPVLREAYWCAIIAMTLNTGAYTSEIIRGGIESVAWGQVEAAKACGMNAWLRFRRVVFPQAIRQALPGYGNEIILMVKATSLASTITLLEVTGIARKIISQTYAPVELFVMAGAIYLTIVFTITRIVDIIEKRLSPERAAARSVKAGGEQDLASVH